MTRFARYKKKHLDATGFKGKSLIPNTQETAIDLKGFKNEKEEIQPRKKDDAKENQDPPKKKKKGGNSKGSVCFKCRKPGHSVNECKENLSNELGDGTDLNSLYKSMGAEEVTGICYHCGTAEHSSKNCTHPNKRKNPFKFAVCFHCQQNGHLAGKCPKNDKGLYPDGGGCNYCGSVLHLAKDCKPANIKQGAVVELGTIDLNQGGDDDDVFFTLHKIQTDKNKPTPAPSNEATKKRKVKVVNF